MIDKVLAKAIRILLNWYYARTHFESWGWGIDDTNDILVVSCEYFSDHYRLGVRDVSYPADKEDK